MEGVEEANRAAVGSCTKLVASLARSGGDPFRPTAAGAETDEAVSMFGKVVTILSNRVGHARARVGGGRKRSSPPLDPSCLLEYRPPPNGFRAQGSYTPAPPPPMTMTTSRHEIKEVLPLPVPVPAAAAVVAGAGKIVAPAADVDYRAMFLETPLLDLNGCSATATATASSSMVAMAAPVQHINSSKSPAAPAANPPPPPTPCANQFQFHQQQHPQPQGKRFQFEQQQKAAGGGGGGEKQFHIEMPPRSKEPEVISFSFDNSACTSSASFFTSISSQLISMSDAAGAAAPASRTKATGCGKKGEDADGRCHCPKKKKPREKRVVRMPAISDKVADIPADNYSWRKYGQKPIKGSPHPRGYYRCSSIKECPARKHVERCRGDAGMLIVTYENDHNHAQPLDLSTLPSNSEA